MRVETVHALVDDQADIDYHRAVWILADALSIVGVRDRVVPALLALFDEALLDVDPERRRGHRGKEYLTRG